MTDRLVLYGGGDLAVEVAAYVGDLRRDGAAVVSDVVSNTPPRIDALEALLGVRPVWHAELNMVEDIGSKRVLICIGDAAARHRVLRQIDAAGAALATLIHPTAYVARTAAVGEGSIVAPFAFVGPFARLGRNCLVNVQCVIGHDVELGDSTVLSPGSDINGHGRTGIAAFLGAGAIVHPRVSLGAYSKLSAGSVLSQNTGAGFLMHGNPARGRQMVKID